MSNKSKLFNMGDVYSFSVINILTDEDRETINDDEMGFDTSIIWPKSKIELYRKLHDNKDDPDIVVVAYAMSGITCKEGFKPLNPKWYPTDHIAKVIDNGEIVLCSTPIRPSKYPIIHYTMQQYINEISRI